MELISIAWNYLRASVKAVPANVFAVGIVGIVAACSISIHLTGGDWFLALAGGIAVFAAMVVLRIFSAKPTRGPKYQPTSEQLILTWFCLILFMVVTTCLAGRLIIDLFGFGGRSTDLAARAAAHLERAFAQPLEGTLPDPPRSPHQNYYRLRQAAFRTVPYWSDGPSTLKTAVKRLAADQFFGRYGYTDVADDIERIAAESCQLAAERADWLKNEVLPAVRNAPDQIEIKVPEIAQVLYPAAAAKGASEVFDKSADDIEDEIEQCDTFLSHCK